MTTVLNDKDNANEAILYMAMELSDKTWKLGFGDGTKQRLVTIEAADWLALHTQIDRAKAKFKLPPACRIISCYEAGRDGFWIHRRLLEDGIENRVIDSSSIEVNRCQAAEKDRSGGRQRVVAIAAALLGRGARGNECGAGTDRRAGG